MKLYATFSEAIRAADGVVKQSELGPEARAILDIIEDGRMCAIEAGLFMVKGELPPYKGQTIYSDVNDLYPYLDKEGACPRCGQLEALGNLLWHLNDQHELTFNQIARWLESEEEKLGYVTVVENEFTPPVEQIDMLPEVIFGQIVGTDRETLSRS